MAKKDIEHEIRQVQRSIQKIAKLLQTVAAEVDARERKVSSKKKPHTRPEQLSSNINDNVRAAIARARKGISISEIKEKTGLQDRQINNALYKLTQKGVVQTKVRGVYVTKSKGGSA